VTDQAVTDQAVTDQAVTDQAVTVAVAVGLRRRSAVIDGSAVSRLGAVEDGS
jgi:hypothetical protein